MFSVKTECEDNMFYISSLVYLIFWTCIIRRHSVLVIDSNNAHVSEQSAETKTKEYRDNIMFM